jgi:hypothetical protein
MTTKDDLVSDAAQGVQKPVLIPGNALQLDLGESDTAVLVATGPFLSISPDPSPGPYTSPHTQLRLHPPVPAVVNADADDADNTADSDEPKRPRVHFRSRVRIRGLRRTRTRSESSDSGSRSSTVSVPLNMHSDRRVLGLKISALTARVPVSPRKSYGADPDERSPLLSDRSPRPPRIRRPPTMRPARPRQIPEGEEGREGGCWSWLAMDRHVCRHLRSAWVLSADGHRA